MIYVKPKESAFASFVAANFGSFPTQEELGYFEYNYKDIFNPEHKLLDAAVLSELYQSGYFSAVNVTCAKLRINYHDHGHLKLFILDVKKSQDLLDFWNLRATHSKVVPIPIQWIDELSSFCKKLILNKFSSLQVEPDKDWFMHSTMFARSIPENTIEEIYRDNFKVDNINANIPQEWYPSIWDKPSDKVSRTTRPTLAAETKSMDIQISGDNPEIRIDPLFPEFTSEYGNKFCVANVVRLQDWGYTDLATTVFPCNYKNPTFPKFRIVRSPILPTTEGLVILPEYRDFSEQLNLYHLNYIFSLSIFFDFCYTFSIL